LGEVFPKNRKKGSPKKGEAFAPAKMETKNKGKTKDKTRKKSRHKGFFMAANNNSRKLEGG